MAADEVTLDARYVRQLLRVLGALADGDVSVRMPSGEAGEAGRIAESVNHLASQLSGVSGTIREVTRRVQTEALRGEVRHGDLSAGWLQLMEELSQTSIGLCAGAREVTGVLTAVIGGDLDLRVTQATRGSHDVAALASTVNRLIELLDRYTDRTR